MTNRIPPLLLITVLSGCASLREKEPAVYEFRVEKDVPFLAADRAEKCDLYLPAPVSASQRFPAIVVIHGGGWKRFDKADRRETSIATDLVRHGYVCMSINYYLGPKGQTPWPRNLLDCKTAIQFLRANAGRYSLDPDRIGAIGGSAGGHLACMLGVVGPEVGLEPDSPWKGVSSRVQAVVNLYGVTDLTRHYSGRAGAEFGKVVNVFDPDARVQASPVTHVSKGDAPVLSIHGTNDETVSYQQALEFQEVLTKHGVENECVILEGAPHSFDLHPKERDLCPTVFAFFDRHLKP